MIREGVKITGTSAGESIAGTDGDDIIDGLGGNDQICSLIVRKITLDKGRRRAPIVGARNYSQPHSQEARVGRLVPIVIVTAIDIFYRLGDLVGVLLDIIQRGDSHCVEFTSG